jgi:hypothetical protein
MESWRIIEIQVAFVPYWILEDPELWEVAEQAVSPARFIGMHLPWNGWQPVSSEIEKGCPECILFHRGQELQTVVIETP